MGLEQPVNAGFRYKIFLRIGEPHGQFTWRQFRFVQCQIDDLLPDIVWNAIPDAQGLGRLILQSLSPAGQIFVIPSLERSAGNTSSVDGSLGCQMRLLDQADNLKLLRCRISHAMSSPSPIMLFLRRRSSRVCTATTSFRSRASRRRFRTSPVLASRTVSPARRFFPASRNSFDQEYYCDQE